MLAGSRLNMSPLSAAARSRVVATRIGTRDVLSEASTGTSTPCNGRPAQEAHARAAIKAPTTRQRRRKLLGKSCCGEELQWAEPRSFAIST